MVREGEEVVSEGEEVGREGETMGREGEAGRESIMPWGFGFWRGSAGIFFVVYNLTGIWISRRGIVCLVCFPAPCSF